MRFLMQSGRKNLSKEVLLARVWGFDSNAVENHVEVYVGFLRKKLAAIAFSDRRKLAALNGITHPLVTKEVEKRLADARKRQCPFAVIDAPLLFESGEDKICDVTVGILADEQTRLLRILARDGIDREAAEKRLAAAKNNEYFRERCGCILENDGDEAAFEAQIRRFFEALSEQHS